jgi:O-antigen ligase
MAQRRPTSRARGVEPAPSTLALRVALWLALLAVIAVLPGAFNRWVLPKDAVLAVAALVGAFGIARGRLPRWFWIAIGAGAIVLILAVIFSAAPIAQLWGRYPRYEGLITLPVYLAAVWLGARIFGPVRDAKIVDTFRAAVATVALLLGALSVVEALGGRVFSSNLARPGAFLGNATDQGIVGATFFLLLVPVAVESGAFDRRRVLAIAGTIAGLSAVVLSESRAAILAAIVGLVVLGVFAAVRAGWRRLVAVVLVPLAALAVLVFAIPDTRSRVLGLSPLAGSTITDRFAIWNAAFEVIGKHPLLGVGPSGFLDAVPATYNPASGSTLGIATVIDSPHAWPLQFALAGGIPLLVLALAAAVVVLVVGIRAWNAERADLTLAGAIASLVAGGFALATHLTSPGTGILECLLIGIVVARAPRGVLKRPARVAIRVGLAAWAVFLSVMAFSEIAIQSALTEIPTDAAGASRTFNAVQGVRFWDSDLSSIAAESFAAASDSKVPGAAALAVSWAHRSLAQTPNTQAALVALGVGETASGNLAAAHDALATAYRNNKSNEQALYRLGVVSALQKNFTASRGELLQATVLKPTDADPWNALAYVEQELGNETAANAAHAKAVALGG